MVYKSKRWLWLLIFSPFVHSDDAREIGQKLNVEFKRSAQVVVNSGPPKVIDSDMTTVIPIDGVLSVEESVNSEEVAVKNQRAAILEQVKAGTFDRELYRKKVSEMIFPVKSKFLPVKLPSREVVISKEIRARFVQPVAVIGTDELSLAWLSLNLAELRRVKATVIVTQVDSLSSFMAVREIAQGLSVTPVNADELLSSSGIRAYPIVLTAFNAFQ